MASVENVSTKKIESEGNTVYNFRNREDIFKYINYTLNGNEKERPLYSSSNGFVTSSTKATDIAEEVEMVQKLYQKDKGIRIRGENVTVKKDELMSEEEYNDPLIFMIADGFSKYYIGRGFQNAYGVYDKGDSYEIKYAINTTSFADGTKYKHNEDEIREQEERCVNTLVADATGRIIPEHLVFDFDSLEYSEYIEF